MRESSEEWEYRGESRTWHGLKRWLSVSRCFFFLLSPETITVLDVGVFVLDILNIFIFHPFKVL